MTVDQVRNALLDDAGGRRKEIRTNDGRLFLITNSEHWALGHGLLVVLDEAGQHTISVRNISSIGAPTQRRRRRRA